MYYKMYSRPLVIQTPNAALYNDVNESTVIPCKLDNMSGTVYIHMYLYSTK